MKLNNLGFTLVEMMVVIAIGAMLMGLVIMVGVKAKDSARANQTAVVLENLNALLDEYSVIHGDTLFNEHQGMPVSYPAYPDIGPASSVTDTETILADTRGAASLASIITTLTNSIDQHASGDVVAYNGATVTLAVPARLIRDAWGHYIWYQPSQPSTAEARNPLFDAVGYVPPPFPQWTAKGHWVSAGADGVFGTADDIISGSRK